MGIYAYVCRCVLWVSFFDPATAFDPLWPRSAEKRAGGQSRPECMQTGPKCLHLGRGIASRRFPETVQSVHFAYFASTFRTGA